MDWSVVISAAVAASITGVLSYLAGRANGRAGRREEELRDWRSDAAALSAEIQTVVVDRFRTKTLRALKHQQRLTVFAHTLGAWTAQKTELRRIAAGHPEKAVFTACQKVEMAIEQQIDATIVALDSAAPPGEPPPITEVLAAIEDGSLTPTTTQPQEIDMAWAKLDDFYNWTYSRLEEMRKAML